MPVVPAPPEEEIPRIEMALVPEVSIDTPGVNLTISEKSRMPFWSRASCVSAVMLIGTLLMFSSRRVAVTTISSSAQAGAGALVAAGATVSDGFASLATAAAARLLAHTRVPKNNKEGRTGPVIDFEGVAGIKSPQFLYGQITLITPTVAPRYSLRNTRVPTVYVCKASAAGRICGPAAADVASCRHRPSPAARLYLLR